MSVEQGSFSGVGAPLGNDNAVGNSGGGAPLGNSNAIGNDGGGAPEGNENRKSHGVHCSLEKIDERVGGEAAELIDEVEKVIRERSNGNVGVMAREIPLRLIRYDRAVRDIQNRGLVLDDGEPTPMLSTSRRLLDGIFEDLQKLGAI
jgi:hypothetical protein